MEKTSNFDEFKGKDCIVVADWLKPKAYTSCVPYLKVFKNDLYYSIISLKYVLSNEPYLHAQLQKHNRSYCKVQTVIW